MTVFEKNIIGIYGDKGKTWFSNLQFIVDEMSARWGLSELKPVNNLSYNYVLSGLRGTQPIILKLGLDTGGLRREAEALMAFAGFGVVRILAQQDGMLFLERAMPGVSLKSYFPFQDSQGIQIACTVMKQLHRAPIPKDGFPHISDWLVVLDKDWDIPSVYLKKARELRGRLLETSPKPVLLHGDLHHDNILENNSSEKWLVIDPKGVIGDPAYEVAAFIRNPIPEFLGGENPRSMIVNRIADFSKTLDIDPQRIKDWCFVEAILSWAWGLEDGCDVDYFKRISELFINQAS